ncbi:MAG: PIN domain-containing protein [Desulfobacterales bacterium]|nr:PIN domain-containing protein [Desulfobacterales bacterium]
MSVIVDTSVWIAYFRAGNSFELLDPLIDENLVVTNDLILAELIPFLKVRNQKKVIDLMYHLNKAAMNIHWEEIIDFQCRCLQEGINGVGIPDLIVAQNALQNHCAIFSLDNHFKLMQKILKLDLHC